MGEPIKVGTKFRTFEEVKNRVFALGSEERNSYESRDVKMFHYDELMGAHCQGEIIGKKSSTICIWGDGTTTKYTNEYSPKQPRTVDKYDCAYTRIYDWGYDSKNKQEYYYRADDINGNGEVDEGEIKTFNSLNDMFNYEEK